MSAPKLTTEPAGIRAGDTASWLLSLSGFPAGDGWFVQYDLVNATGRITLISTAEGDAHRITKTTEETADYAPGTYAWQKRAKTGTDAYTIGTGSIDILPDLSIMAALDTRTRAQKSLAAIEAWIESHDPGVAEYEIAGRRMKYIPITELLKLRSQYAIEVRRQSGKSGRILMRS